MKDERKTVVVMDLKKVHELECEKSVKPFVDHLFSYLNTISRKGFDLAFARLVLRQHRTLQQSLVKLMVTIIHTIAADGSYDLRNEASVKLCKRISEFIQDEDNLPYI